MMRILVFLVAAAVGAVELVAPSLVEARIEATVESNTRGVTAVSADLDSFPLVTRALVTERVEHASITLSEVAGQQLRIAEVRLELDGVRLERAAMFRGEVQIEEVERGVATAAVDLADLASAMGVTIDPSTVDDVRVEAGVLVVVVAGGPEVRLTLPLESMPCQPSGGVEQDRLVLRCSFDEVPPVLLRAVNTAS